MGRQPCCPSWARCESGEAAEGRDPKETAGALAPAIAPSLATLGTSSGLEPQAEPQRKRPVLLHRPLPLLGSNQDSPDPEGAVEHPEFQQLATLYASSCHPMLGCWVSCWTLPYFTHSNVRVCCRSAGLARPPADRRLWRDGLPDFAALSAQTLDLVPGARQAPGTPRPAVSTCLPGSPSGAAGYTRAAYLRVHRVAWVSACAVSLAPTILPAGLMANA
jgi:hypothetical protein